MRYDDAPAAVGFLVDVLGFTETLVVAGPTVRSPTPNCAGPDHVDAIHAKAVATGAEITAELHGTDFGSHTFTLRDTEGNAWTIGTYRGAP